MKNYENVIEELTLILLYLKRFEEKNEFTNKDVAKSWKGYNFSVLNSLETKKLIFQGENTSRNKALYIEDLGMEKALDFLKNTI